MREQYPPRTANPSPGHFWRTFAWTAGIFTGISLVSTAGAAWEPLYLVWGLGAMAWLLTFIISVTVALDSDKSIVAGLLAGLAVGSLALVASCFANASAMTLGPGG